MQFKHPGGRFPPAAPYYTFQEMKTKQIILALALCITSCTIKEDRLPCPCLLRLDFGTAARHSLHYSVKGWGYGESLFGENIEVEDWPDGWTVRVPKGEIDYSACSALTDCAMKGNSVIVPEGKAFDRVWAGHKHLSLSDEETMDRVETHKQWAEVTVQIKNLPDGGLNAVVTGNSIGFSLSDLSPVEGPFRTTLTDSGQGTVSFNIPRQGDSELNMVLICDGAPVKTYELGKMIARSGYDWNAEDLDDIYLGIDYTKLENEILIEPWQDGDIYDEVRTVSIIPVSDGMQSVRSSFEWDESEIKDIQLMVEDEHGNASMHYFSEFIRTVSLSLATGRIYRICAVANIGKELSLSEMYGLLDGTWRPEPDDLARTGIPMTGSAYPVSISNGSQNIILPMTRMLARIDFTIDGSRLKCPEGLEIESVCIYDGSYGKFDHSSAADLSVIQKGGTISMYAYENLMGDLLPYNRDPWAKVPSSIGSDAEKCSWLEVECSYDSGTQSSDDITYRMYLGKDNTTNFDVRRNTVYTLTLIPSEEEIYGDRGSWKISSSGWVKIQERTVTLVPSVSEIETWGGNSYPLTFTLVDSETGSTDVTSKVQCTSISYSTAAPAGLINWSGGNVSASDWWGRTGKWTEAPLSFTMTFSIDGTNATVSGTMNGYTGIEFDKKDYYFAELEKNGYQCDPGTARLVGSKDEDISSIARIVPNGDYMWETNNGPSCIMVGKDIPATVSFTDPSNKKKRDITVPLNIASDVVKVYVNIRPTITTGGTDGQVATLEGTATRSGQFLGTAGIQYVNSGLSSFDLAIIQSIHYTDINGKDVNLTGQYGVGSDYVRVETSIGQPNDYRDEYPDTEDWEMSTNLVKTLRRGQYDMINLWVNGFVVSWQWAIVQ